jgi:hypothetical protein
MSIRTIRRAAENVVLGLGAGALLLAIALGCAVPGALLYRTLGPPPIPARYAPPKDLPLLVLVENVHSGSQALPEADDLAKVMYDDLKENKVAPLVDPARLHDLRDADSKGFAKMTIAQIGQAVGARQVLYVHVRQLDLENPPGSEVVKARVAVDVKVVDVATARTAWPDNGETEPFAHETRLERVTEQSTRSAISRQVLRESGEQLARWFYDFKPETMGEENADVKLR